MVEGSTTKQRVNEGNTGGHFMLAQSFIVRKANQGEGMGFRTAEQQNLSRTASWKLNSHTEFRFSFLIWQ